MTRFIILDYFGAFRRGRSGQSGAWNAFSFWPVYYFLLMIIIQRMPSSDFGWRDAAVQAALFVPMFFVWCSVTAHPPRLARIMYLCPMDRGERRRYIRASYGFRVCVHMLVCALGLGIAAPFSYCDIYSVLLILANDFTIAVLVCHGGGNAGTAAAEAEGTAAAQSARTALGTVKGDVLFAAALGSNLIQYGILADPAPDMGIKLALSAVFCIVQVPLGLWYGKDIGKELEAAAGFESLSDRRAGECR